MQLFFQKYFRILIAFGCVLYFAFQAIFQCTPPQINQLTAQINLEHLRIVENPNNATYSFTYDQQGSIITWNNYDITPPSLNHTNKLYDDGVNLFLFAKKIANDTTVIGLTPLTCLPVVKNSYFQYANPTWLGVSPRYEITTKASDYILEGLNLSTPLYLVDNLDYRFPVFPVILLIIGLGLLIYTLYQLKPWLALVMSIASIIIIYVLGLSSQFGSSDLFQPSVFAFSSWYNSLASLFTHNSIIAIISLIIIHCCKKYIPVCYHFSCIFIFHVLSFIVAYLLIKLIENSIIPFDFTEPLSLNRYSFIALLGMLPLLMALTSLLKQILQQRYAILTIGISTVCMFVVGYLMGRKDLIILCWPGVVIFIHILLLKQKRYQHIWSNLLFVISLSILFSHVLIKHNQFSLEKEQKLMAEKLSASEDPILHYILSDFINTTSSYDSVQIAKKEVEKYITTQGYMNKYHVQYVTAPLQIKTHQISIVDNSQGGTTYLLQLYTKNEEQLEVMFETKLIPNHLGFPELLIAGDKLFLNKRNQFQFAQYSQGVLVQQYGNAPFPALVDTDLAYDFKQLSRPPYVMFQSGNKHNQVIVSRQLPSISNQLSVFSFFILSFLLIFIAPTWFKLRKFNSISVKLRSIIILTVLGTLIAFAIGSWNFIILQQNKKNSTLLIEKANSVLTELSHKLENYESLSLSMNEFLTNYLVKFSNVFFTDINLYHPNGYLLASSRNEVYSKKLRNKYMEPTAYQVLHNQLKTIQVQSENIGNLNYLSVYMPFKNDKNQTVAYLNLPYFAKQNVLDSELSGFLTAMLNLFLLLLTAALIVSLVLANSLTKPLRWLQQSLAALDLSENKAIPNVGNNEIAELIAVYNRKVLELEEKAKILAETERNTAWKEMAKQVAHEIKNPLTPMKLQIQYLQKTAQQSTVPTDRLLKTTTSLIEQIDTLARIADEFSHFSSLPKSQPELIQVADLLTHVTHTFVRKGIHFQFKFSDETIAIHQDRSQLVRVLNNIVKNAIQAFSETQSDKTIQVSLSHSEHQICITIGDNAGGIPAAVKKHIFEPKFTTKSQGMGLGLAMCKTIITNMHGSINFEDNMQGGTDFHITIPM